MLERGFLGWLTVLGALLCAVTAPVAQFRQVVPDDMLNYSLPSGDHVRFCINSASALSEFDRAVGERLTDLMLVRAQFHELVYPAPPSPYEYELLLPESELFIQMTNHCDALLGYPLPVMDVAYEWLTVTPPYYEPRFVMALAPNAPEALENLPQGTEIGSRIGIVADMHVRAYVQSSGNQWKRHVYPTNTAMISDLSSGALAAAIIWEPAVAIAAQSDPAAASIRTMNAPFALEPAQLAIALPSNQTYLRELLTAAITELRANGDFGDLLEEYGLPDE